MIACLFFVALACSQDSSADLIKSIEAIKEPPLTSTTAEAIATWEKGCDEAAEKKAVLIWKLYTENPGHAEVPKYLDLRWDGMTGRRKPCETSRLDRIDQDTKAFLAKTQLPQNKEVATFWAAKSRIWRAWGTMLEKKLKPSDPEGKKIVDSAVGEADRFHKTFPNMPDGSFLYYDLSQMAKGDSREIDCLLAVASKYPTHRLAASAKGRAKMLSNLGKPFELSFEDVKTGKRIDLKDYRGKVVLLDFWATWCQPCRLDIEQELLAKAVKWKEQGVEVIGISLDVPEDKGGKKMLLDYIAEKSLPWPNYYDGKGQIGGFATECGVVSIPAQFLIDKNGILRSIDARRNREKLIEEYLK